MADHGSLELRLVAHRDLAGDRLLQVGIDALVGVQIRAVWGQVEDLDVGLAPGQPGAHRRGAARWTGRRSRIRNTLRPASRTRRPRKRISVGALSAPSSTIQRSSPLLVSAE